MVYLNYNNLDHETLQLLLPNSKGVIEERFGGDLRVHERENYISYDTLLKQEA